MTSPLALENKFLTTHQFQRIMYNARKQVWGLNGYSKLFDFQRYYCENKKHGVSIAGTVNVAAKFLGTKVNCM
jgi:subtilase family serine protease